MLAAIHIPVESIVISRLKVGKKMLNSKQISETQPEIADLRSYFYFTLALLCDAEQII